MADSRRVGMSSNMKIREERWCVKCGASARICGPLCAGTNEEHEWTDRERQESDYPDRSMFLDPTSVRQRVVEGKEMNKKKVQPISNVGMSIGMANDELDVLEKSISVLHRRLCTVLNPENSSVAAGDVDEITESSILANDLRGIIKKIKCLTGMVCDVTDRLDIN